MTQQHLHNGRSHFAYAGHGLADWLGTVPSHWSFRRAKNFFREIDIRSETGDEELLSVSHLTGVTPRSEKNVTMFEAESYEGSKLCWPGDLVINTMWAWMGALGVSSHHGIVSPSYGVYRLTRADAFNPRYLDFLLRTQPYASEYYCRSTGIRDSRLRLYPDQFLKIPLLYPPRDEQDAIVAFLDRKLAEIDRFIANKRSLIALLDEERLVHIDAAVTSGFLDSAPLRPSDIEFVHSFPASWKALPFTKYAIDRADYRGATPEKVESGVFLVTAKNIGMGYIDYEASQEFVRLEDYETIMRRGLPRKGDVLLTTEAPLGHVALVDREDVALAQRVIRFRMNPEVFLPQWCLYSMMSGYFQNQLQCRSTGSTAAGIKASKLPQLRILAPPLKTQSRILEQLEKLLSHSSAARRKVEGEIALMNEMKRALVLDVVTGKISVRSKT